MENTKLTFYCVFCHEGQDYAIESSSLLGLYSLEDRQSIDDQITARALNKDWPVETQIRIVKQLSPPTGSKILMLTDGHHQLGMRMNDLPRWEVTSEDFDKHLKSKNIQRIHFQKLLTAEDKPCTSITRDFSNDVLKHSPDEHCLLVDTAAGSLAIPIEHIAEIATSREIKSHILVNERSLGCLFQRGNVIPVIQIGPHLSQYKQAKIPSQHFILILKTEIGLFGFPTQIIHRTISLIKDQKSGESIKTEDGKVWNFFTDKIYDLQEIQQIINGYHNIYPRIDLHSKGSHLGKQIDFLEFQMGETLYTPLLDIREIAMLDLQNDCTESPLAGAIGVQKFLDQNVPIFDGRTIYRLPQKNEKTGKERVLFFKNEFVSLGILVDSIHSIVRIDTGTRMDLSRFLLKPYSKEYQSDIADFYYAKDYLHKEQFTIKVMRFTHMVAKSHEAA